MYVPYIRLLDCMCRNTPLIANDFLETQWGIQGNGNTTAYYRIRTPPVRPRDRSADRNALYFTTLSELDLFLPF